MSKKIVITGASSGIGLALAKFFESEGHTVIGISRSYPKEELGIDYYLCDLSIQEEIEQITSDIRKKYHELDVLINCAGIGISGSLEFTPMNEIIQIFNVNLFGLMKITSELLPLLKKVDRSKIINIGSVAGEITLPFQAIYTMTKSSLQRYTEGLRMELKPFKINACSILPGDTKTGFTEKRLKAPLEDSDIYQGRVSRSIMKMERDEQIGVSPYAVVKVVNKMIDRKRLPVAVIVGIKYKLFVFLNKILPRRLVLYLIYQIYGK